MLFHTNRPYCTGAIDWRPPKEQFDSASGSLRIASRVPVDQFIEMDTDHSPFYDLVESRLLVEAELASVAVSAGDPTPDGAVVFTRADGGSLRVPLA